jgi:hypothetical protein
MGLASVDVQDYLLPPTGHVLSYWACRSMPNGEQDPAYYIYLRGRGQL